MILSQILHEKRLALEEAKAHLPQDELVKKLALKPATREFKAHIAKPHGISLIAEIKKASPSRGVICPDFDPAKIAGAYALNGASAISVLTDKKFFQGDLSHLKLVKDAVNLPVLRKDFIIDEYQVYESSLAGADAILLIADILAEEELKKFISLSKELGMAVLVEVHTEADVEKTLKVDAELIGINNRDLHTFKVDLETTSRLVRLIPKHKIIVSESGITTHEDVAYFRSLGVHAVLIGEAFLSSPDIGAKVKEVMGR